MIKIIDRLFIGLMAFATLGHLFGTFKFFGPETNIFVWSLSGALAASLLVALNILRNTRPQDKTVATITLFGNLGWFCIVLLFGHFLGNYADFRVLFHGTAVLGLICFSIRTLVIRWG